MCCCILAAVYGLQDRLPNHPCNRASNASDSGDFVVVNNGQEYKCHCLTTAELLAHLNCSGTYKERFSAITLQRAKANAAAALKGTNNVISKQISKRRVRRDISPGTTEIQDHTCVLRCSSDTQTGNQRACGECATIYRQPSSPRRFPEYVNGVICNPNESNVLHVGSVPIGTCVQKTIVQDFLQWTGMWEQVGDPADNRWAEAYVPYTHTIDTHCAFQLYPGLPCA